MHKYASKSTLHYELGVDILMGNLIWISGPCPVGKYTDRPLSQARRAGGGRQRLCGACQQNKGPQQWLQPGGEPRDAGERKVSSQDLNRGILSNTYCHNITKHDAVFYVCAVITQLAIVNGEPLFEVEYGDD